MTGESDSRHGEADRSPVRLTAHPLQRIGGYALACLASGPVGSPPDPEAMRTEAFEVAVERLTTDAVRAAVGRDTKVSEGFFLKCSLSLFPNSVLNHPSNSKRDKAEIADRVLRDWRRPDPARSPDPPVACVLCGQPASGFYGKRDVPLAESDAYRNTTPPGHQGLALCWPCLCCFHALPYGSHLTGGPSWALHSWDECFLARTVARQVIETSQDIECGPQRAKSAPLTREVLALRALRGYDHDLRAGVELLVYGNNNRGPVLEIHALDQVMAEWLRRTMNRPVLRHGYRALLRAHRTTTQPGHVGLARNAFHNPDRIPAACAAHLATSTRNQGRTSDEDWAQQAMALAAVCFDYADTVMLMDNNDLQEIKAMGQRIALLIGQDNRAGQLREFYSKFKDSKQLRSWLQRQAVEWVMRPPADQTAPLLTTRGFGLLFDPDIDNQAWFHRQLLLVAVVEELRRNGWRPEADEEPQTVDEIDISDDEFAGSDR